MAQRAARVARGNLPAELTSFIGRRRELAAIRSTLSDTRLLTLTGPGGVGKTRLAVHAARELSRTLPHGVWLVELQELRDPGLMSKVIMTALGLRDQSDRWPLSLLTDYLEDKQLLLVLDNCEHLLDACSVAVDAILQGTPAVRVLATSRQPLNTYGETVFPVPTLAIPGVSSATSIDQLRQFEAVALFCERAAAASGQFELSSDNQAMVIELCRQLDGMPLALELAAVRTRALGIEEILARLKDRFDLLVGGSRSTMPRQQTLRATIDWSHDLLPANEQALFRRLAVFAGDFDLDAVEAICSSVQPADEPSVDVLSSLVEKSLVNREGTSMRARFRLNETMHEYALGRLRDAGEVDAVRAAHLRWYRELGARAEADSFSPRLLSWFDRLDSEASNIRAALQYCLDNRAHLDAGLDLAASLHLWWAARAFSEAIGTLQSLLSAGGGSDGARARALFVLGTIHMFALEWVVPGRHPHTPLVTLTTLATDQAPARSLLDQALPLARAVNDRHLIAEILLLQALGHVFSGATPGLAEQLLDEARALASATADPRALTDVDRIDAFRARQLGDLDTAGRYMRAANLRCREHGDSYVLAQNLFWMGLDALQRGDPAEAEAALLEALTFKRWFDDRGAATILAIDLLAAPALAAGNPTRAARLQGASAGLRRQHGLEVHPIASRLVGDTVAAARASMGDAAYAKEFELGAALEFQETLAYALGEHTDFKPEKNRTQVKGVVLGKREEEVGTLVAEGLTNKEIASRLLLSVRTVETHVHHLLNKLGVNSRTQIGVWFSVDRGPGPGRQGDARA